MKEFDLKKYLAEGNLLKEAEKEVSDKARREAEEEGYEDGYDDAIEDAKKALDSIKDESEEEKDKKSVKEDMDELPKSIRDKEQAQIEKDARKKGLTKEGLKDMIKEKITSILNEAEDVDVEEDEDVEIDIKKDVKIDDESEESTTVVKSELPGESTDTSEVLGLLTKAQEEAQDMNDEVLMDQIGNTITYFTRKHVVKSAE
jgi:hypothetical protein